MWWVIPSPCISCSSAQGVRARRSITTVFGFPPIMTVIVDWVLFGFSPYSRTRQCTGQPFPGSLLCWCSAQIVCRFVGFLSGVLPGFRAFCGRLRMPFFFFFLVIMFFSKCGSPSTCKPLNSLKHLMLTRRTALQCALAPNRPDGIGFLNFFVAEL